MPRATGPSRPQRASERYAGHHPTVEESLDRRAHREALQTAHAVDASRLEVRPGQSKRLCVAAHEHLLGDLRPAGEVPGQTDAALPTNLAVPARGDEGEERRDRNGRVQLLGDAAAAAGADEADEPDGAVDPRRHVEAAAAHPSLHQLHGVQERACGQPGGVDKQQDGDGRNTAVTGGDGGMHESAQLCCAWPREHLQAFPEGGDPDVPYAAQKVAVQRKLAEGGGDGPRDRCLHRGARHADGHAGHVRHAHATPARPLLAREAARALHHVLHDAALHQPADEARQGPVPEDAALHTQSAA